MLEARGADAWTPAALLRIKLAKKGDNGSEGDEGAASAPTSPKLARNEREATADGSATSEPLSLLNTDYEDLEMAFDAIPKTPMLHAAIDDYCERLQKHISKKAVSEAGGRADMGRMQYVKTFMDDMPLAAVDYYAIRGFVTLMSSRPLSPTKKKKFAAPTVIGIVVAARAFFTDLQLGNKWGKDIDIAAAFKLKRNKLYTEQERKMQQTKQIFTIDELALIWKRTNSDRQRCFMLLGLNCGMTQMELATLKRSHIFLDHVDSKGRSRPYIERERNKTQVIGKWRLWPETADMLRSVLSTTPKNQNDLAFTTSNGLPLISYGKCRQDSVTLIWRRMLKNINSHYIGKVHKGRHKNVRENLETPLVRPLSFKYLRKTGADMVKRIGGKDMSEVHLQHSDSTQNSAYTNRDFVRLAKVLRKIRIKLNPMLGTNETLAVPTKADVDIKTI